MCIAAGVAIGEVVAVGLSDLDDRPNVLHEEPDPVGGSVAGLGPVLPLALDEALLLQVLQSRVHGPPAHPEVVSDRLLARPALQGPALGSSGDVGQHG